MYRHVIFWRELFWCIFLSGVGARPVAADLHRPLEHCPSRFVGAEQTQAETQKFIHRCVKSIIHTVGTWVNHHQAVAFAASVARNLAEPHSEHDGFGPALLGVSRRIYCTSIKPDYSKQLEEWNQILPSLWCSIEAVTHTRAHTHAHAHTHTRTHARRQW